MDVAGFVARVAVTQVSRNPFPDPIEAVYTFPLSDRGAVDAMTMKTGDRVIQADIERREDARRRYEAARDAGKLASLLDQGEMRRRGHGSRPAGPSRTARRCNGRCSKAPAG